MALPQLLTLIDGKIRDTAGILDETRRLEALQAAVEEYSTSQPRVKIATITGDGDAVTFDLPSDFEEGLSSIKRIEYPIASQVPDYLDEDDYRLYRDPTSGALKLRLTSMTLPLAAKAYVEYTTKHHVLAGAPTGETLADTVPAGHRNPVAALAASYCALMLAAHYAQSSDPTIGADAVDYKSKSSSYLDLARALRKEFSLRFGGDSGVPAASAIADLDVVLTEGRGARFFHSNLGPR